VAGAESRLLRDSAAFRLPAERSLDHPLSKAHINKNRMSIRLRTSVKGVSKRCQVPFSYAARQGEGVKKVSGCREGVRYLFLTPHGKPADLSLSSRPGPGTGYEEQEAPLPSARRLGKVARLEGEPCATLLDHRRESGSGTPSVFRRDNILPFFRRPHTFRAIFDGRHKGQVPSFFSNDALECRHGQSQAS
jgi:hypothetical protein